MSTTTPTRSEAPTQQPERRPARVRYLFATAVFGLTSIGAAVLTTLGGDSTSPTSNQAPVAVQPAPSIEFPHGSDVFSGCLNDIECSGEPSNLPPGYWDLPVASSVD